MAGLHNSSGAGLIRSSPRHRLVGETVFGVAPSASNVAREAYGRAVFRLDARDTPGSDAAGNTIQDLSANALRTQNGTTGNAKIVQDGRGGKALRLHGGAANTTYAQASGNVDLTGDCTLVVEVTPNAIPASCSVFGDRSGSSGEASLRFYNNRAVGFLWYDGITPAVPDDNVASINGGSYEFGERFWIAVERDNAAPTNWQVRYYRSLDGVTWELTATDDGVAPAVVTPVANALRVGADPSLSTITGLVHKARAYQGFACSDPDNATLVADFDPTRDASYSSLSWTSATTGETWTVTPGGSDNSDVLFLPAPSEYGVERYVYLPGLTGNYLSAPDEAALDITGDLDLRVHCALDDWTSAYQYLLAKWSGGTSPPSARSYYLMTNLSGGLRFGWSDGTTVFTKDSTAAHGVAEGAAKWFRATLDVDNGASGNDVKFFTSDDGTSWTQLGSTVTTAGATAIVSGSAQLEVGGAFAGTSFPPTGRFFRAQVYDGIDGTPVFDWSAEDPVNSTHTSFTASTGQTVTVNRATSGRKTVVVEQQKWLLGTDDYIEVADNALLDLDAATDFTVLAVVRQHATPTSQGRWVDKRNAIAPNLGWSLRSNNALAEAQAVVTGQTAAQALALGSLSTIGLRVSGRSASAGQVFVNGTLGSTFLVSGGHENSIPMRIGRVGDGTNYQDFELYAVYVWREALSASELAAIAADWGAA